MVTIIAVIINHLVWLNASLVLGSWPEYASAYETQPQDLHIELFYYLDLLCNVFWTRWSHCGFRIHNYVWAFAITKSVSFSFELIIDLQLFESRQDWLRPVYTSDINWHIMISWLDWFMTISLNTWVTMVSCLNTTFVRYSDPTTVLDFLLKTIRFL